MNARVPLFESGEFGADLQKALTVIDRSEATFNVRQLRRIPDALGMPIERVMMLCTRPWSGHESMRGGKKAFYEYGHALWTLGRPAAMGSPTGVARRGLLDASACVRPDMRTRTIPLYSPSRWASLISLRNKLTKRTGSIPGVVCVIDTEKQKK
jgi:glutamate synthase domain-containing protein 1